MGLYKKLVEMQNDISKAILEDINKTPKELTEQAIEAYKMYLEQKTQYKITGQTVQMDGTAIVKVIKRYDRVYCNLEFKENIVEEV